MEAVCDSDRAYTVKIGIKRQSDTLDTFLFLSSKTLDFLHEMMYEF